ncbi:MAG TPA: hypothetical protein VGL46_04980 [Pseudonocardiaceae bacterium]
MPLRSHRAKADEEHEPETGPRADQHPALHGDVEGEVISRSADGSTGSTFRKTFVVAGPAEVKAEHPCHEANAGRTLEEAIQRGLHPRGKAALAGTEVVDRDRKGTVSTACTYEVEVVPAVIDTEAHRTVTPSSDVREKSRGLVE